MDDLPFVTQVRVWGYAITALSVDLRAPKRPQAERARVT